MGNLKYSGLILSTQDGDFDVPDAVGGTVLEEARPKLKRPSMYKVVMMNDDYTPMDFVIEILEVFFGMGEEQATQIMLKVHNEGKAVCGVFTRDIAETKAAQVNQYAQENEHPLLCEIEVAEEDDQHGH